MEEQRLPERGADRVDAVHSTGEIAIQVNGEPYTIAPGATVSALLRDLELAGQRVAVAVDRTIVPRSRHGEVTLAAGNRVEILEAVGGG